MTGTTEHMYQRINNILDSIENDQLNESQQPSPPPPPQPANRYPSHPPPSQQAPQQAPQTIASHPHPHQVPQQQAPPEWLMSGIQHQQNQPEDYSRYNPKEMMESDEISKIVDDIKNERLLKEKRIKREMDYDERRSQISKASIISVIISSLAGIYVFASKIKSMIDNKRIQEEATPSF